MKLIQINSIIGAALLMVSFAGCSKILDEKPRSIFTPEFSKLKKV